MAQYELEHLHLQDFVENFFHETHVDIIALNREVMSFRTTSQPFSVDKKKQQLKGVATLAHNLYINDGAQYERIGTIIF